MAALVSPSPTRDALLRRMDEKAQLALRNLSTTRMEVLRSYRMSWWSYWSAIAEVFLPYRYKWFVTPNQLNRGSPVNGSMIDETGMLAARTLAHGLLANLTSPDKPWFKLGLHGMTRIPEGPVKEWLAECTRRTLMVLAGSNFYTMWGQALHDNVVFGSSAMLAYEDKDNVVQFQTPPLGQFFFALNPKNEVDTFYEEFNYTVQQCVDEFGYDNCSVGVQVLYRTGGGGLDQEVVVAHSIGPNKPMCFGADTYPSPAPSNFRYVEVFWDRGSQMTGGGTGQLLRVKGYHEKPFVGLRWNVTANDPYGRSPGMDALPAVRQLQTEQRRKAEAIEKMVRPPLMGSVSMKNEPVDALPGGVTYVTDMANGGLKPVFQVEPRIQEMMVDIQENQGRVKEIFFNDLFSRFMDEQKVQTATWVNAAAQEKLVLLGPVVERMQTEGLDQLVFRVFNICSRRGIYPPAPPEIAGLPLSIQYVSIFAEAQAAASTAAIERLVQFVGSIAGVRPDVLDTIKWDDMIERYADQIDVPPDVLASVSEIVAIRQQRVAQQQQEQMLQSGAALATGAKTLSDADVGGGQNALQAVLGRAA